MKKQKCNEVKYPECKFCNRTSGIIHTRDTVTTFCIFLGRKPTKQVRRRNNEREGMMLYLLVLCWVIGGILMYGYSFAYWQGKYPTTAKIVYWLDMCYSIITGLFFPIFLLVILIERKNIFRYGLKFR